LSGLLEDAMTLLESTAEKHVREDVNCLELAHDIISGGVLLLSVKNFMIFRVTTNCSRNFFLEISIFALIFLSTTTNECRSL
jgi:hypothetical protein